MRKFEVGPVVDKYVYVLTLLVTALQLLNGSLNVLHAALFSHILGREVAVKTSTVPVTGHGLGVE